MEQDFYELLEIPDNANEAWINRGYERQRQSLATDTTLTEAQRKARTAAVLDAYAILSNPKTRELYDRERLRVPEVEVKKKTLAQYLNARTAIWGAVGLLAIGTTWGYWHYEREHRRQLEAEARGAAEVALRVQEVEERDRAQRASIEKISGNVEREQEKLQSEHRARKSAEEAAEAAKEAANGDLVGSESAILAAER
ncbi:MAG: DnaJ domain-containing protein, partial [Betaproteobacteria bacterium]